MADNTQLCYSEFCFLHKMGKQYYQEIILCANQTKVDSVVAKEILSDIHSSQNKETPQKVDSVQLLFQTEMGM